MIDVGGKIVSEIAQRASKLDFRAVYRLVDGEPFILAGGALCGDAVHDFDLYPHKDSKFNASTVVLAMEADPGIAKTLNMSGNAITVRLVESDQVVQFCDYRKPSLEDLVKSFDFSHVQVGILFCGANRPPTPNNVFYTDAFVAARVLGNTEYMGSEYPLSSLIRLGKYIKRGKLDRRQTAKNVMKIMADIVERGFDSYADFKHQLDAIDLACPEFAEAYNMFEVFKNRGLIANKE